MNKTPSEPSNDPPSGEFDETESASAQPDKAGIDIHEIPEQEFITKVPYENQLTRLTAKETAAHKVAMEIVHVFKFALLGGIVVGFLSLTLIVWACHSNLPQAADIFSKTALPLLTTLGTFTTTIFGPLLAFVLGYYFGEKK